MDATVTSKGQLTLPKALRDDLSIQPGDSVSFEKTGDGTYRLCRKEEPTLDDIVGAFAHLADEIPKTAEARRRAVADMLVEKDDRIRREASE